ncbi:hypothetical protein [Enterobacter kobei]|uniref:hypothetical protein n=1 Tax=Enterobacter kobei TaxID=208224 RepID=UPI000FCB31FF|nr:hypothetical protein [Enterobacter kobei]
MRKPNSLIIRVDGSPPRGLVKYKSAVTDLYGSVEAVHFDNVRKGSSLSRQCCPYQYLSGVESDIRTALDLPAGSVSFTREGDFYNNSRTFSSFMTGLSYALILGVLLFTFLGMRLLNDWHSQDHFILITDTCLTLGVLYFFMAYANLY